MLKQTIFLSTFAGDFSKATNFIRQIGDENVICCNVGGHVTPQFCIIFYDDTNLVFCPKCGFEYAKERNFCIVCGSNLVPIIQPDQLRCGSCGKIMLAATATFCDHCGAPQPKK